VSKTSRSGMAYTAAEIEALIEPLKQRIAELEAELKTKN